MSVCSGLRRVRSQLPRILPDFLNKLHVMLALFPDALQLQFMHTASNQKLEV